MVEERFMNRDIERSDPDSETSHAIHETESIVCFQDEKKTTVWGINL